jgi:hypothetical protein
MSRFVLLRHQCPANSEIPSHWDFMLEREEVLWTWQLQQLPKPWWIALGDVTSDFAEKAAGAICAIRLADHRLAYLDYEGPISRNRGTVTRCDAGTYTVVCHAKERLEIQLAGNQLQGRVVLEPDTARKEQWLLSVSWNERSFQQPE